MCWIACLKSASNFVKEVCEADGEHRNKWNTLGARKYELMTIWAARELISLSLSAALARSSHLSTRASSSANPGKKWRSRQSGLFYIHLLEGKKRTIVYLQVFVSNELTLGDVQGQSHRRSCTDYFLNIWGHRLDWTTQCDVI